MTTHRTQLPASTRRPDVALRAFRTPVRGHAFAARPPGAGAPRPGQRAHLRREPDNPVDPLAVAVWVEDGGSWWRVGYLDEGVAARLGPRMDRGLAVDARVDGWVAEPKGRWRRPVVVLLPRDARATGRSDHARPPEGQLASIASEGGPSTRLWGRPPGVVVRPVRAAGRPRR